MQFRIAAAGIVILAAAAVTSPVEERPGRVTAGTSRKSTFTPNLSTPWTLPGLAPKNRVDVSQACIDCILACMKKDMGNDWKDGKIIHDRETYSQLAVCGVNCSIAGPPDPEDGYEGGDEDPGERQSEEGGDSDDEAWFSPRRKAACAPREAESWRSRQPKAFRVGSMAAGEA